MADVKRPRVKPTEKEKALLDLLSGIREGEFGTVLDEDVHAGIITAVDQALDGYIAPRRDVIPPSPYLADANKRLRDLLAEILAQQFVPAARNEGPWKYGTLKLTRALYDRAMAELEAGKS
jgi:hypothetical protein